jgi:hypothetical protein
MHNFDWQAPNAGVAFDFTVEFFAYLRFTSYEQDANVMMTTSKYGPFHFGLGSPVGAHRIDRDYSWHLRKADCNLAGLFRVEDLAALVVSTFGTRAVRHLLLMTVGTLGE